MSDTFRDDLVEGLRALRGFARTFHRDPARAEDLVQETMLKAWGRRDQFKEGTNMRAWLFTILRNTYLSELRKKKREVEDADGSLVGNLAEKPPQDGHMAMRDFRSALAELNEDQREALILVGASGFSYEEAGEIVGVAAGTIKSRVSRARQTLTEMLGEGAPLHDGDEATVSAASPQGLDRAAQAF
ncbi:sigma-70 family RNA polymerase sigma factor [Rhodobacteraceae bacterium NNCM2]|nr:sigma-70 family RNA polymerase sigma factor [Coraliihabitans acroporae]